MKYHISGLITILIAVWGCAFGMTYFESTAYDLATYVTSCLFVMIGIVVGLKGIK